jgi:hypothetical protein
MESAELFSLFLFLCYSGDSGRGLNVGIERYLHLHAYLPRT